MIIPCFWANEELVDMTDECLASMDQEPDEIIIVDDGSPIHAEFANTECVVLDENVGFPGAVNAGLKHAEGDILIISNNDIIFYPNWLTELLLPLQEGFDISSIVTSDQGWETKDLISEGDRFGSLWAMKRKVYETLGGFDERFGIGYFEDADYYMQAKKAGFRIGKNWNGLVEHKAKGTFSKVDPDNKQFLKNREIFKDKWGFVL